jgi:hypothetical protein
MKRTPDLDRIASAQLQRPQGVVLKGQFTDVLRSPKGKIKGVCLQTETATYAIKLPKYLRPVLVRELTPGDFVQVWAYCEAERWRGINILPLAEPEQIALQASWQSRNAEPSSRYSQRRDGSGHARVLGSAISLPRQTPLCTGLPQGQML